MQALQEDEGEPLHLRNLSEAATVPSALYAFESY